jgi:hypothetical protein
MPRRRVPADDHAAVLKVWSKRHRDLGRTRTQVACRLHAVLCELIPGGVCKEITAGHAAQLVEAITPAGAVQAARCELAAAFLDDLRRSITWDQGKEMAEHARFSVATGVPVYFCDPRSPWQRGTNENTNGLLRQYFPRSTDFRSVSQQALDAVAAELNDRPRQTLRWNSPCQALDESLR